MMKLISAVAISVAFSSTCSACWFPFFPVYSGWGMPGPGYSYGGYAPSYGYGQSCGYGYRAAYAPQSFGYASYGSVGGCSTCGQSCGGSCCTTTNYLGGINMGCGSANCASVNCIPESNTTNRPVPDKLEDAGTSGGSTYEADRARPDTDPLWPNGRTPAREPNLNDTTPGGDFRGSGSRLGTEPDDPSWKTNRRTDDLPSDTFRDGLKPPMEEPTTFGSEGAEDAGVINRGANKPPMTDPLQGNQDAAPEAIDAGEGEGDLLAPEPDSPTARRFNLFFASHKQLRSSHSEVLGRQRLAGHREGSSRTTQISSSSRRTKAPRWISLPMPVGQTRL